MVPDTTSLAISKLLRDSLSLGCGACAAKVESEVEERVRKHVENGSIVMRCSGPICLSIVLPRTMVLGDTVLPRGGSRNVTLFYKIAALAISQHTCECRRSDSHHKLTPSPRGLLKIKVVQAPIT